MERKWRVIPFRGAFKDEKGTGTNCGKSGTRHLEAESIGSRVESVRGGGSVKLKTLTEIGLSNAWDTFVAESVCLVQNSLWHWKQMEIFYTED